MKSRRQFENTKSVWVAIGVIPVFDVLGANGAVSLRDCLVEGRWWCCWLSEQRAIDCSLGMGWGCIESPLLSLSLSVGVPKNQQMDFELRNSTLNLS